MALGYGCLSLCGAEGTGEKAQNVTVILMVGCQGSWVTLSGSRDGQGLVGSGQKELESEASGAQGGETCPPSVACPLPGCEILDASLPPSPTLGLNLPI